MRIILLDPRCTPTQNRPGDAGYDLRAKLDAPITLNPGEREHIPNGFIPEIPLGFTGLLVSRSGLGSKGIVVANQVGVIDSNFRGELTTCLRNTSNVTYTVEPYEKIAQLVITLSYSHPVEAVSELSTTERGTKGFGSSGRV